MREWTPAGKGGAGLFPRDLFFSGFFQQRSGFARMTAEVALGHVGIVFGLEVSRVARNNADGYRLFDLCSITDTLVGDNDGLYHPALFNDRLVLGLKGIMAEAELHILRARLGGGIRNKAARGELRRSLPVGFVWGEQDGEVRFDPDESVSEIFFPQTKCTVSGFSIFAYPHISIPLLHLGARLRGCC